MLENNCKTFENISSNVALSIIFSGANVHKLIKLYN